MQTRVLEIPLNKLVPSAANVRRTYRDGSAEELAASITAHGLLQSLNVRPELDECRFRADPATHSGMMPPPCSEIIPPPHSEMMPPP